jgi:hypothetical protein
MRERALDWRASGAFKKKVRRFVAVQRFGDFPLFFGQRERFDAPERFACDAERLPTGCQQTQLRAAFEEPVSDLCASIQERFAVIELQQGGMTRQLFLHLRDRAALCRLTQSEGWGRSPRAAARRLAR